MSGVVLALVLAGSAWAQDPADPVRERLIEFYLATNGDQWLQNDGWLDDERPVCDWYGVICEPGPDDEPVITELRLPDNNLTGTLASGSAIDEDIFSVLTVAIDLSDNRLEGPLRRIPLHLNRVNLSRNLLSGPLPSARAAPTIITPPPNFYTRLHELDLSSNRLQGAVPEDWSRYELSRLDLANNELDGGIEHAFAAMRESSRGVLNLADNLFFGVLDPTVASAGLAEKRGLNLCWNSLQVEDPALSGWIDARHMGGAAWRECLDRDRELIDAGISGSWFVPERAGEGVSLHLLEDDRALLYWFTFDVDGKPLWLFEVGRVSDRFVEFDTLRRTRGDFGFGMRVSDVTGQRAMRGTAQLRADRLTGNTLHFERLFTDMRGCPPAYDQPSPPIFPILCPIEFIDDRFDQNRLTRLAGTRCDAFNGFEQYSGAWFDPARDGEGFVIEVLEDRRVVVYWFTYQPDGSGEQVWMMGVGEIARPPPITPPSPGPRTVAVASVRDLIQPRGGVFGPDFDPDDIEAVVWGDLNFSFLDDGTAEVAWDSLLAEFGAGRHPLVRI
ncbi:MAG: hypothetical protein ACNA7E_10900, partial [Wenzhouxiangellaceae bacterium]